MLHDEFPPHGQPRTIDDLYTRPVLLFHWSPRARRNNILRRGLVPGSRSITGEWKPPYVCYSDSPSMAWCLSGQVHRHIPEWDLWSTWSNIPNGLEVMPLDHDQSRIKEIRIYERVWKRDLWWVGSRPGLNAAKAARQ